MIESGQLKETITIMRPATPGDGFTAKQWQEAGILRAQKIRTTPASGSVEAYEEFWAETATLRVWAIMPVERGWRVIWQGAAWEVRAYDDRHDGSAIITMRLENE